MLSLQDSLWGSTHGGTTRVTQATLRNSASVEIQGKEVLSLRNTLRCSTHPSIRWRHRKVLRATSYRRTYKSQNSFFGSQVMRFVRDLSRHIETPTWNFYKEIYKQRWYQNGLLIAFLEESREEYLKCLCKQTPLWLVIMSKSLRNPEEQADRKKKDVEQSASPHTHHTHCPSSQLGTIADRRCDVPRDWLWEACHMARVRWGTRCKGFHSKEGPHYWMERSAINHLECDQVQRAPEKLSSSCRQTSNNQPYSRVWKTLWDSFPELYCVDLAEAYVTWESVSSRI